MNPSLTYKVLPSSSFTGSFAVICLMVAQVIERELQNMSFNENLSAAPTGSSLNSTMAPPSQPTGSSWTPLDAKKMEIAVSLTVLIGIMQVSFAPNISFEKFKKSILSHCFAFSILIFLSPGVLLFAV